MGRGGGWGIVAAAGRRPARARDGPGSLPDERPPGHRRWLTGYRRPGRGLLRVRLAERERPVGERGAAGRQAPRGAGGGAAVPYTVPYKIRGRPGDRGGCEAPDPARGR